MMGVEGFDWRWTAASTLEWWAEAGVDVLVEEAARDWLAAPVAPAAVPEPGAVPSAGAMPGTWEAFRTWRTSAEAPDAGLHGVALTASGPAAAAVMVLADCPDPEDASAGALLSGAAGRLFDRMLAAISLSRAEVHLAAVCAKRPLGGRPMREIEPQLFACARHHVGVIGPKRLLVIGDAASRAILGTEVIRARGISHPFHQEGRDVSVVATWHPRLLLKQPERKADAWKDLRLLIDGLDR